MAGVMNVDCAACKAGLMCITGVAHFYFITTKLAQVHMNNPADRGGHWSEKHIDLKGQELGNCSAARRMFGINVNANDWSGYIRPRGER